ncbi:excisionase family DNA-binding protein [Mycobacterium sp. SA01]|uniref:excisionase family DNA-binding protein n=1 Tax=Mycobacterium sp. SA01 TaxID=3238820 RepID=UPI00351B6E1C
MKTFPTDAVDLDTPTVCPNKLVRWATKREAAEHVRVSEPLIAAAVRLGYLQAYAIGAGRDYRLDLAEVDAWLKSRSWEPR